jgi:hypothetical protein
MPASLTVISGGLPAALGPDLAAAVDLAKAEKAASTRKAYGTDFRIFRTWCEARGVSALPAAPETVAAYLAANAGTSKASTLGRRIAAIRYATSWRISTRPRTLKPSRQRCAVSGEPTAAPGCAKRQRWQAKCLAWWRQRPTSLPACETGHCS